MNEDRMKLLKAAIDSIEKQFGKGSIMKLDGETKVKVDIIPTGCLVLDLATGIGGVPGKNNRNIRWNQRQNTVFT